MKIGVTGATGKLGSIVIEKLKQNVSTNDAIVVLVRTPEKAAHLGVEVRKFDYNLPETQRLALVGIDVLLLISGNEIGQRAVQHAHVIESAQKAGVKRIVYTSLLHADRSSINLAGEHFATENNLKASGLEYTILRNGWYTENYAGSVPGAIAAGAFVGCAGNGKIASATRADFAEAAVVALTGNGHANKTYELAGDEAYTLTDLAAEISRQTGKHIPYQNLSEAEYAGILKGLGFPEFLAAAFASWDTGASKGDLFDNSRQLSALIGRPTTSLTVAVKDILATL
jgi:NAD(P)H dehydrogenase (quinone)